MQHATYFLNEAQYNFLAGQLPTPISKTKQVIPNAEVLNGIVFVLRTGCRWQDMPASICTRHYSTCWRRFRFWQKRGALKLVWQHVLVLLDHQGQIDLSIGNLDGSLVQAPQFAGVGYDKQHKRYGTNISLLTGDPYGVSYYIP